MTSAKGKAYANKKSEIDRPIGDYYSTPKSLVWVMKDTIIQEFPHKTMLEPCHGQGAISQELELMGYDVTENDLYQGGEDYITSSTFSNHKHIVSNPPFSLWDEFVDKAKSHCSKFMYIGRLNYLGTNSRYCNDIWKNLKAVYCFNRYVDYQTPFRTDGNFHVGAMATAWFLWDMEQSIDTIVKIVDVQPYAILGNYKNKGTS